MHRWLLLLALIAGLASGAPAPFRMARNANDWPQFRGPNRDNVSPDRGLLRAWPAGGPTLLWKAEGVGLGFSSVVLAGDKLYTMGDKDGSTFVYALSRANGKLSWSAKVGTATTGTYAGSRSTPTVDGGLVYALTHTGELVCLEARAGGEKWRRNLVKDFGGKASPFGYAESPLVDGESLICTPGGAKSTMVALSKLTGKQVWSCPANLNAGYASIAVGKVAGVKQYVQLTAGGAIGVSAKDGSLLWKYDKVANPSTNGSSPLVIGENVFTSAGLKKGGALLALSAAAGGKVTMKEMYLKTELMNKYGGMTVVGRHIFGDTDSSGRPFCADWKTGALVWQRGPGVGDGRGGASMAYADGHLYVLYESGHVALVPADAKAYSVAGSFKVPNASGNQSRAAPVVIGGRLYLRERDVVWCYDVSKK
jgi:outer membrane protein assembly factor BamB